MIEELKPYESYQESQVAWAPRLPAYWTVRRAKTLFERVKRQVEEGAEVVTCFRDGTVTLRRKRRLTGYTEAIFELGYQGIRRGDLVIHAMDAFAGAVGVSDSDGKASPVYAACVPRDQSVPAYYALVIRQMAHSQWILALAKGIRERSTDFRFEVFGTQFVPVPPPEEQAAIVRFLDHANRRIEQLLKSKRREMALLAEQKDVIVERAVTRGLHESKLEVRRGLEWLGATPADWSVTRIKYLLREVDQRSRFGTETLLSVRMHHGVVPFAEHFNRPPQAASLVGFKVVRPGQLVINRMQAGNGVIFPSRLHGLVSPDYAVFEPLSSVSVDFLGELFRCRTVRTKFRSESKGLGTGTSGFLRLYNDRLGAIHVSLPNRSEQDRILAHLSVATRDVDRARARLEREVALISEYRTRLVADVVTGQLDVRTAAAGLPVVEGEPAPTEIEGDETDIEDGEAA